MTSSESSVAPAGHDAEPPSYDRVPAYLKWLLVPFVWLDRQFNRLYGSAYNPLYRSGTWATTFLLIALASGIYLLIFYRVSAPYESVKDMVAQPWLVGWVRSLHRYASDAAVVAVVVHILRMLAEGKTWGSRALAWLSGIVLVGIVLVVGFTGYVMVWDTQAQALALAGAKFMNQIPIFDREMGATFDNVTPPPTSFIFMNLIVHLLLPLFLFGVLWLHTMRVARAKWLPSRRVAIVIGGGLSLLALLVVAPLSARPDALVTQPTAKLDLFYSGWLLLQAWSSWVVWPLLLGLSGFMISVPWVLRPRAARRPAPSQHDERHCEGCSQCVSDCPFDAIEMAPRTLGTGPRWSRASIRACA
ncbi:MAG: cytochrome b N-terminal domain-containing protein [Myxococcales bacterium]|nr:cytochrome b N-terminal domain-containing protein [Myxococcales bacterium]